MSVQAMSQVFALGPEVSNMNRLVLLSLANHAGETDECWPSIQRLADECGCHYDTARAAVRWLVEHGYVERRVNAAPDGRIPSDKRPNLYRLTLSGRGESPRGGESPPGRMTRTPRGESPGTGVANRPAKSSVNRQEPRRRDPQAGDKPSFFAAGSGKMREFRKDDVTVADPATVKTTLAETRRRLRERPHAAPDNDAVEQ